MAGKEIAVKKYVVRLDAEERDRTQRVDPQRQAFGPVADEGAHPVEGGRIGCRRRLERQPDRRGTGHQHRHCRADQAAAGRGRVRSGAGAQIQSNSARPRIFDGAAEAKLIALACSPAPAGYASWSLRLLEEKVVELHIVGRQRQHDRADAKKNNLKPHLKQQWVIPPDANAAFVAAMEDVLDVYQRPHDPQRPLVCLDETSKQLITETRAPIPAKPDNRRATITNTSATASPICSWCSRRWKAGGMSRSPTATPPSTMPTCSGSVRHALPEGRKIVLVQDNLNTHTPASLYEAFPAPEARRLVERFEWHYTPKHGSWLDLAESELGVLASPVPRSPHR